MKRFRTSASRREQQAFLDYGDRVVDGDTTTTPPTSDLESTFLRVQRVMRAETSQSSTMPEHLRTQTWETIMQNAAIPNAGPQCRPRTQQRTPSRRSDTPLFRMAWTGMANAALAVLIFMAGFGAWRVLDGGSGGGSVPPPQERQYAQAPMTPVPAEATDDSNALTACDFSDEVPIYNQIDAPPVDGTVLYVTTSHDLMLHCDEEPQDILLSRDVQNAYASQWPGVVNLGIGADTQSQTSVLLNVITNEWVEPGYVDTSMTMTANFTNQSPFAISAHPEDPTAWMLTDLRTMESRSLGEIGGVDWPAKSSVFISENGRNGSYGIALRETAFGESDGPGLAQPDGFPGEILFISQSLGESSWIDIPGDFLSPFSFDVSPDGTHVAVLGMDGSAGTATIGLFSTTDGTEVTRTETFSYEDPPQMAWVQGGEALVYLQSYDGRAMMITTSPGAVPQTILESDGHLFDLRKTHDADVVTVLESTELQETWMRQSEHVHAINTRTGISRSHEGISWDPQSTTINAILRQPAIILVDQQTGAGDATTIIDPASGDVLLEVSAAPISARSTVTDEPSSPADTLAVSTSGQTEAFTIRHSAVVLVDFSSGPPSAREVAFPEFDPPAGGWTSQISLSPSGTTLSLSIYADEGAQQWTLDLADPNATWVQAPTQGPIGFMPALP